MLRQWLEARLRDTQSRPMRADFDLSEPRNVYEAARCQGESRVLRLMYDEERLLGELERLAEDTYGSRI